MRKILATLLIVFLIALGMLFFVFSKTIFQEGNPIPVAYAMAKIVVTNSSFAKLSDNKYIVRATADDKQKLTAYLAEHQIRQIDQMGAGLLFKSDGKTYTAISRMYTNAFEVWDFRTPVQSGLVLP